MPSGILGVVNGMTTVESWTLTESKTSDSYVASNTLIGTQRGGGIRTWNGSFNGRGTTPPAMPGETFAFVGQTAESAPGTSGQYSGDALVSSVSLTWDWATNTILAYTVDFAGQPGLAYAEAATIVDGSIPYVGATCGTKVEYATTAAPTTFIEIPSVTTATLTITSALSSEANSSTIADGTCWTANSAGPIDWTVSLGQEDYIRGIAGYPDLGALSLLKIYVDDTDSYLLKFAAIQDYSGLLVDINTGATIARTLNFGMAASDGATLGNILLPGQTTTDPWWGPADPVG